MSLNLLQSSFRTSRRKGVRLEFYLTQDGVSYGPPTEPIACQVCGKEHPQLYTAWRKPVGFWGAWTVFRYLGEEHTPDLSIPIAVPTPPKGAVKLSARENAAAWHR